MARVFHRSPGADFFADRERLVDYHLDAERAGFKNIRCQTFYRARASELTREQTGEFRRKPGLDERVFEPVMKDEQRARLYAGWKKAVERAEHWEE